MVRLTRRVAGITALAASATLVAAAAFGAALPVDEPFDGAAGSVPEGWVSIAGQSSPPIAPAATGDGWLRLTSAQPVNDVTGQVGAATLNESFPSDLRLSVDFDYRAWGGIPGNHGDGFAFFLLDGSAPASVGGSGGTLGYFGMVGAYLGVEFDEYGNASGGDPPAPGNAPNSVVLRGSAAPGWPFMTNAAAPGGIGTGTATGDVQEPGTPRHVHIDLVPEDGSYRVSVSMTDGTSSTLVPVLTDFDTVGVSGQGEPPTTLKVGFSASTGGATRNYDVSNLVVRADTDLAVAKTTSMPTVDPGDPVRYTVTATNPSGPNDAIGAQLSDTVPAGITGVTWSCSGTDGASCETASGSGNTVDPVVNLPVGGTVILTIDGTAGDAAAGTTVTNTATITPPDNVSDTDEENDSDSADTTVRPFVDLSVTKSLTSGTPILFGEPATWLVTVANSGAAGIGTADNVVVTDTLPPAVDPATVTTGGTAGSTCARTGATLTCDLGDLAAGASTSFTVTGTIAPSADTCTANPVVQTATVTSARVDSDPTNNTASTSDACVIPVDLRLDKTATATARPGDPVVYSLVVTNRGDHDVAGATVTDTIPAGITDVDWVCTATGGASCATASGSGNAIDTLVDLPTTGTVTLTARGTASASTAGTSVTNQASVSAPEPYVDTDPDNNQGSATTVVTPFVDLEVTKTLENSSPLLLGAPATWAVTLTNHGPGDATGVVLTDDLPTAVDPASVVLGGPAAPDCTLQGTVVTCDVGDLAAGAATGLTLTGTVGGSELACSTTPVTQQASVTSDEADPDPTNDAATLSTPCAVPVGLAVSKSGPSEATVGDTVEYTITAMNAGTFAAPGTRVSDDVPASITDVTWTCTVSDGSACDAPSGTGNAVSALAAIPAGGTATVTVRGTASAAGSVTNTATVTPCAGCVDPDPSDDTASVRTVVAAPVTPPTTPTPTPTPTPSPSTAPPTTPGAVGPTTTAPTGGSGGLPVTGADVGRPVGLAFAALALGFVLVLVARRRA